MEKPEYIELPDGTSQWWYKGEKYEVNSLGEFLMDIVMDQ